MALFARSAQSQGGDAQRRSPRPSTAPVRGLRHARRLERKLLLAFCPSAASTAFCICFFGMCGATSACTLHVWCCASGFKPLSRSLHAFRPPGASQSATTPPAAHSSSVRNGGSNTHALAAYTAASQSIANKLGPRPTRPKAAHVAQMARTDDNSSSAPLAAFSRQGGATRPQSARPCTRYHEAEADGSTSAWALYDSVTFGPAATRRPSGDARKRLSPAAVPPQERGNARDGPCDSPARPLASRLDRKLRPFSASATALPIFR